MNEVAARRIITVAKRSIMTVSILESVLQRGAWKERKMTKAELIEQIGYAKGKRDGLSEALARIYDVTTADANIMIRDYKVEEVNYYDTF